MFDCMHKAKHNICLFSNRLAEQVKREYRDSIHVYMTQMQYPPLKYNNWYKKYIKTTLRLEKDAGINWDASCYLNSAYKLRILNLVLHACILTFTKYCN